MLHDEFDPERRPLNHENSIMMGGTFDPNTHGNIADLDLTAAMAFGAAAMAADLRREATRADYTTIQGSDKLP